MGFHLFPHGGAFWSVVLVHVLLGDVSWTWQEIEIRHPYWRWLVAAYVAGVLHCLLAVHEAQWREALKRGVPRKSLLLHFLRLLVGGWVGALSWMVAFAAMGGGWLLGGTGGLVIGVVIAKITYIPWLAGVFREVVRKDLAEIPISAGEPTGVTSTLVGEGKG